MPATMSTREKINRVVDQIKRSTGQEEADAARRANWRFLSFLLTKIELEDEDQPDNAEPLYVSTYNISTTGLGFFSRAEYEPGRKMRITLEIDDEKVEVSATVVHSTRALGMYKTGVKFDLEEDA